MKALHTIDLGKRGIKVNGKTITVDMTLHVYHDDVPFDGDCPDDIAAFERGDFAMYVAEVRASFQGMVDGADFLGGIAATTWDDIEACVEEHGMEERACDELIKELESLAKALT